MNIPSWLAALAASPVIFLVASALSYYQLYLIRARHIWAAAMLSPILSAPLIALCMGIGSLVSQNRVPGSSEAIIGAALTLGASAAIIAIVWRQKRAEQANKSLNSDAGNAGAG